MAPGLPNHLGRAMLLAWAGLLCVSAEALSLVQRSVQKVNPFQTALVVTIDQEDYKVAEAELRDQGVPSEMVRGFNAKDPKDLEAAVQLLTEYGNAESLHETVSNWLLCMHTSPGKPPNISAALSELRQGLFRPAAKNVRELLARDSHGCVPKVVAIAATHLRLWRDLANGVVPSKNPNDDSWYLVMEDDATLCPTWRQRMLDELPGAPADADVIKLYFFGHWRKEDQVGNSSFLEAKDPLRGFDLLKAALYEGLHGASWKQVPIAGFYAGTQAYLIRPSGARKLLQNIRGKPFQDIDMTMMLSVKNYVWRRVLVHSRPEDTSLLSSHELSLVQSVPDCNTEPPTDQFW